VLADPDSKAIRDYQVLNAEAMGSFKGMDRPGYYFIDPRGIIREKFFEAKYRERLTANNVIAKLFPELGEEVVNTVQAPHLEVAVRQSDRTAVPGGLITLIAEVRLPRDVHVYAPGTKGYKPIQLVMDSMPEIDYRPAVYPQSKILLMRAIQERVPVFEGTFQIRQDVRVSAAFSLSAALPPEGKTLSMHGSLHYQACDSKTCFVPTSTPVEWQLHVLPLDRQRAPEEIRHK
jgi:hypothetical protein